MSSGRIQSSRVRSSWPRDILRTGPRSPLAFLLRRLPMANRPSISQASVIITAPVVVIVSDTV
ncbi:Uncharacterised protein [Mycobacteroides abscessus subsp. massiliense]|nr:Uncharacterised protein [Mycobacteroides abscessus subsp. massiliense]